MGEQENSLKRIFNLVVFLYEDLRHKLITIVDNYVEIDKVLSEDQIDLIKQQQDIIDEYLVYFDLKKPLNFVLDLKNMNQFSVHSPGQELKKYFKIEK